jgi:hypothetical protein
MSDKLKINGFDCDGVITVGVYPGPNDVIITGRSYEEQPETQKLLDQKGIKNRVYFNPLKFDEKTRASSGQHKAKTLIRLRQEGIVVENFFEDDPIQKSEIEKASSWVNVIHLDHSLTEKENIRRNGENDVR